MSRRDVDVVIVGAGLAGLTAANRLLKDGWSVRVLEARDRVGGRVYDVQSSFGMRFPLGAAWFGPDETALPALMAEAGLSAAMQYEDGATIVRLRGRQRVWPNEKERRLAFLPLPRDELPADLIAAIDRLGDLSAEISPAEPHAHPSAAEWDRITVEDWCRAQGLAEESTDYLRMFLKTEIWTDIDKTSFLFYLFLYKSLISNLVDDRRVAPGPQAMAKVLASRLGDRVVLEAPVRALRQDADHVMAVTAAGDVSSRVAIVTVPPRLNTTIDYVPALPAARAALFRNMRAMELIKVFVVYARKFWRDDGLSAFTLTDEGPLATTSDVSPEDMPYGVLIGLIMAEQARLWSGRSQEERKEAVVRQLVEFFGPDAAAPLEYVEHDWVADPYAEGCYTSVLPCGVLEANGAALYAPHRRIHWAGAEVAPAWIGSMEGAILSGQKVAADVGRQLKHETSRGQDI